MYTGNLFFFLASRQNRIWVPSSIGASECISASLVGRCSLHILLQGGAICSLNWPCRDPHGGGASGFSGQSISVWHPRQLPLQAYVLQLTAHLRGTLMLRKARLCPNFEAGSCPHPLPLRTSDGAAPAMSTQEHCGLRRWNTGADPKRSQPMDTSLFSVYLCLHVVREGHGGTRVVSALLVTSSYPRLASSSLPGLLPTAPPNGDVPAQPAPCRDSRTR